MADISYGTITPQVGCQLSIHPAGETLADGDLVRLNNSDGKLYKSECDDTAEAARVGGMIAYEGGAADAPVVVVTDGPVATGNSLTQGPAVLSTNAGKACPPADLTTGNYQTQVGYSVAANTFYVRPQATGVVKT